MRAPPLHVRRVAERAAHHRARTLRWVRAGIGQQRHRLAQRRRHGLPDQRRIPRIVGMHEDRHAGRQQLGPRRRDRQRRAVLQRESQRIECRLAFEVVQLRLRDRRLALGTPDRRRLAAIRAPRLIQPQERKLRDAPRDVADRAIRIAPVDREPQPLPQRTIVLLGLLAGLQAAPDERAAPDLPRA